MNKEEILKFLESPSSLVINKDNESYEEYINILKKCESEACEYMRTATVDKINEFVTTDLGKFVMKKYGCYIQDESAILHAYDSKYPIKPSQLKYVVKRRLLAKDINDLNIEELFCLCYFKKFSENDITIFVDKIRQLDITSIKIFKECFRKEQNMTEEEVDKLLSL